MKDKILYFQELLALSEDVDSEQVDEGCDLFATLRTSNSLGHWDPALSMVKHLPGQRFQTPDIPTKVQVHRSLKRAGSAPTPTSHVACIVKETPYLSKLRSASQQSQTPRHVEKAHPALKRIESAPTPSSATKFIKETPLVQRISALRRSSTTTTPTIADVSVIKETPLPGMIDRPVVERRTASGPSLSTPFPINTSSMLGKRKRKETVIKLKPENQLYFKGLTFYYVPPNDTAPARRLRITKAREHGAVWVKELVPEVTHIIVDNNLTYQEVIRFLKLDSLPPNVVLVNENYPINCYGTFKCLLPPTQQRYMVPGHEDDMKSLPPEVELPPPNEPQKSDKSLQLTRAERRPGGWDYVVPKQTPPQSAESTRESQPRASHAEESSLSSFLVTTGNNEGQLVDSPEEDARLGSEILPRPSDELDKLFETARTFRHLPLDEDDVDDRDSRPSSHDRETDDSGSDTPAPKLRKTKAKRKTTTPKRSFNQANFSCMRGGTGEPSSTIANLRTIEILQEMGNWYKTTGEIWRERAYHKAVGILRQVPTRVCTYEEALELPNIGTRLALKIEEIVRTNSLRRLESAKAEPTDHILQLFLNIYGVGNSQAWKWIHQGYRTLDDLQTKAKLSENQRLGIEHYDELLTRIPREEVTELATIVMNAASSIDTEVKVIVGGSYRRGAASSGDLDCILTKPGTKSSDELLPFLSTLIHLLTAENFLVAALATPQVLKDKSRSSDLDSGSKWHGCCILPSSSTKIWRRIDFLLVPGSQLGAALIYFTGDDIFNRSIRLLASRKGMRLNQRGLYEDVMRGEGRVKITDGRLVEAADEVTIFKRLGVPWRPPHERILS